MDERENLPAKMAAQELTASTEKFGSLVARGMAAVLTHNQQALAKANDALYRQARDAYNRRSTLSVAEFEAIFDAFRRLANNNYGKAYYPLSRIYLHKHDNEDNVRLAQHFSQLAIKWCLANQANQDAELWCDMGDMYVVGLGIAQDSAQAVRWYRKAAAQGHANAQNSLGWMYVDGQRVPQDYAQAVYWYRKSAEQDHANAQFYLGWLYANGKGVSQDDEQAVYWYRKAAEQDDADAREYLESRGIDWENT